MLDAELVQHLSDGLVDQVLNRFWLVLEGGNRWEDDGTGFGHGDHVA